VKPNVRTRSPPLDDIPSKRYQRHGNYVGAEFLKATAQGYEGGSVPSNQGVSRANQGVSRASNTPPSPLGKNKGWTCIRCTFTNENMCFLVCEICDEERP